MKTHSHQTHPKLKTQQRPIFSCGFFSHCTQTVLSPTTSDSPSLPLSPPLPPAQQQQQPPPPALLPPPPPPPPPPPQSSSSSSSSTTSQSFTQWRIPLSNSPLHPHDNHHHHNPPPKTEPEPKFTTPSSTNPPPPPPPPPIPYTTLQELFHAAELHLSSGSGSDRLAALQLLERSLVPNPHSDPPVCSTELMRGVVASLRSRAGAKPATKILLALCLAEGNRRVAVEAGAVGAVVEVALELDGATAERSLATLELTCTVAEGAAELRAHALAVPVMVAMMGRMAGRGREYAIGALTVIYGCGNGGVSGEQAEHAPPEEVARAVVLALQQGDCTARARRKGAQLLKALEEYGRLDLPHEENEGA